MFSIVGGTIVEYFRRTYPAPVRSSSSYGFSSTGTGVAVGSDGIGSVSLLVG